MRVVVLVLLASVVGPVGCMQAPVQTAPEPARGPVLVAAPLERTWAAAVMAVTDQRIPIRTTDRASGLIVGEPIAIPPQASDSTADCGRVLGLPVPPSEGAYTVLVRGDSTASTVDVRVRFRYVAKDARATTDCRSLGVWERRLEDAIQRAAEGDGH